MKTPTLKEKVRMYEDFLHKINMGIICMSNTMVSDLVANADRWSYMHRIGNGMYSEREQQQVINDAFYKLLDTPNADKETKERQEAYTKRQEEVKGAIPFEKLDIPALLASSNQKVEEYLNPPPLPPETPYVNPYDIENGCHEWRLDDNDGWVWIRCGYSFCEHCHKLPKIDCPKNNI